MHASLGFWHIIDTARASVAQPSPLQPREESPAGDAADRPPCQRVRPAGIPLPVVFTAILVALTVIALYVAYRTPLAHAGASSLPTGMPSDVVSTVPDGANFRPILAAQANGSETINRTVESIQGFVAILRTDVTRTLPAAENWFFTVSLPAGGSMLSSDVTSVPANACTLTPSQNPGFLIQCSKVTNVNFSYREQRTLTVEGILLRLNTNFSSEDAVDWSVGVNYVDPLIFVRGSPTPTAQSGKTLTWRFPAATRAPAIAYFSDPNNSVLLLPLAAKIIPIE